MLCVNIPTTFLTARKVKYSLTVKSGQIRLFEFSPGQVRSGPFSVQFINILQGLFRQFQIVPGYIEKLPQVQGGVQIPRQFEIYD